LFPKNLIKMAIQPFNFLTNESYKNLKPIIHTAATTITELKVNVRGGQMKQICRELKLMENLASLEIDIGLMKERRSQSHNRAILYHLRQALKGKELWKLTIEWDEWGSEVDYKAMSEVLDGLAPVKRFAFGAYGKAHRRNQLQLVLENWDPPTEYYYDHDEDQKYQDTENISSFRKNLQHLELTYGLRESKLTNQLIYIFPNLQTITGLVPTDRTIEIVYYSLDRTLPENYYLELQYNPHAPRVNFLRFYQRIPFIETRLEHRNIKVVIYLQKKRCENTREELNRLARKDQFEEGVEVYFVKQDRLDQEKTLLKILQI
jgi:hypothetical protein